MPPAAWNLLPPALAVVVLVCNLAFLFVANLSEDPSDVQGAVAVWGFHKCDAHPPSGTWLMNYCRELTVREVQELEDREAEALAIGDAAMRRGGDGNVQRHAERRKKRPRPADRGGKHVSRWKPDERACPDIAALQTLMLLFASIATLFSVAGNLAVQVYAGLKPGVQDETRHQLGVLGFGLAMFLTAPSWFFARTLCATRLCGADESLDQAGWVRGSGVTLIAIASLASTAGFAYWGTLAWKRDPKPHKASKLRASDDEGTALNAATALGNARHRGSAAVASNRTMAAMI